MQIDIAKLNREAQIELRVQNGTNFCFMVDGKEYNLDILMVEDGVYSILYNGKSYNVETIPGVNPREYIVNTLFTRYELEIVDAAAKYQKARKGDEQEEGGNRILAPMPGKIVSVMAKPGQEVLKDETLVIVSAMKMESEYKAGKDGIIKEVLVQEGDTVDSGQVMVILD
ncbi:MAG: acetyl-CoA carboxylase biotin carboxyl carrier protein subunit [Bacteroidetes bacterium]|jgi:biotin carboxyl carrier protein|nr:acetyl-CoA carboxylase biotin carboxyl carrier protein subunit [Bacteroidota bacterium]MBT3750194.1 acetyl-CoA carboxylase biotin carboxyl carrier protein subunit [Bacteroidota bacterium]MBT4401710.1 acetyl-CoA carboxylase biotin carboxyl carrier protein subunit [Bacteroidota bacterium]MBT4408213.1 acetyl-CoA carboxylase biotin carboxyl carrier protein subunit [Bacteroidota bacterium]MBT5426943.1 acetyl-CoA carboxylase biotin carboxyl carrier protein subunit [Bacteroidota bacterium]